MVNIVNEGRRTTVPTHEATDETDEAALLATEAAEEETLDAAEAAEEETLAAEEEAEL